MRRRVLVARLDSAGDVLLAGPAVRAIAAGDHGDSPNDVVMLCGPQGAAAARLLPGVVDVITWSAPWIIDPAPEPTPGLVTELHDAVVAVGADEAVILTSFHQSPLPLALLLRLAGVRRIAGASVDYAGSLLDVRLKPGEDFPEDQPEAERALGIAEAAGYVLPAGDDGRLQVANLAGADELAALVGSGPYVVVHPGASVPARAWPPLHHAAAVELLTATGFRVVVTGGPGETELTSTVAGPEALDLGGRTDLPVLGAVLAGASVVITGNTGPAHLAAAVGTPVVCLFSPVVPAVRWAPYRVPVELLGDQNAPCALSRARICPVQGHPCLSNVSPEDVVDAALRLSSGISSLGSRRSIGRTDGRRTPRGNR
ncbi:glycosyltransferase family 9 protein [Arthrobacter agilis]|uniref:glycosyltransferase family 9 protein n=1 Tax=Arthrobacter agilis TaxID=37921 RepID=UPI000B35DF03|nr:glycosyltransferase family 9 protein [Arthrobacter agilis]OUM44261.1 glycosyl transferase [Arthrobacter agilis]PPB46637.1 glycosyltransferase family 9 protein [Arthrobacter agilis]TPV23769.1 glycosyltransferase family 9 protein [Arthrobacter agilis]VDR32500.1 Lipopolysaccharide core heptosyltransferase rfaQ [Arthrobacter agilis]